MKLSALAAMLICTTAVAQAPTTAPTAPTPTPAVPSSKATPSLQLDEAIQKEIDAKVAQAKKELQEEMRAQSATQAATQPGWEDATVTSRTKLQLFVAHGYFRARPELFNWFDLGQFSFNNYYLFPMPDDQGHTVTGVNMRFRLEPTINVSEELRIKAQIDMLDNLVWGSTPAYAYTRYQGTDVSLLSMSQVPPNAGINAALSSIQVKRVWGEISTPVGLLKFGRMGTNFGLGINYNDGSCLDCDYGSTIDAFQFIAEPLPGFFIIPMLEYDVTGLVNARLLTSGEQVDVSQTDNATSYRIVLAKIDSEQQAKAKLESGGMIVNFGLDFSYRTQKYQYAQNLPYTEPDPYVPGSSAGNRLLLNGNLSIPDIWFKIQNRTLRFELEAVSYLGEFTAPVGPINTLRTVNVVQFGVAGEAEVNILNGAVGLGFKGGFASGDTHPGFGVRVARPTQVTGAPSTAAQPGDIDGAQYGQFLCGSTTCYDTDIRNYRFNPSYHIDQILWRYILGTITDAWYIRPSARWNVSDSVQLTGNIVYSQAIYATSTPSASRPGIGSTALGLEIDAGIRYQTEDGLFAWFYYGVLFPFSGLQNTQAAATQGLHVAQSLRGMVGIRF